MHRDRRTKQQAERDFNLTHRRKFMVMPWRVRMLRTNITNVILKELKGHAD